MSRKYVIAWAALQLLLVACGRPVAPWPSDPLAALDLKIAMSPNEATLLQPITVHLDLYRRQDLAVEFDPKVETKDFLAETTLAAEVPFGSGRWQRTTLVLRPVRGPGTLTLPPFVARAKDGTIAATTPEQTITVVTALEDQPAGIEAPSALLEAPSRLWWQVPVACLVLAALGLVCYRWPWRRRAEPQGEVSLPPHVRAQRALLRLRAQPRTTQAEVMAFYVEVSNVLRVYLEERFLLRAPERTTEEFLRELESGDQLAREQRSDLERFLSSCDLVKFAAHVPPESEHMTTFEVAEAFVERTRADRMTSRPAEAVS